MMVSGTLLPNYLREICCHVVTEPTLQPLTSESLHTASANISDAARVDIKANGFWDCFQQSSFFDVRILNPTAHACCHIPLSLSATEVLSLRKVDNMRTGLYRRGMVALLLLFFFFNHWLCWYFRYCHIQVPHISPGYQAGHSL